MSILFKAGRLYFLPPICRYAVFQVVILLMLSAQTICAQGLRLSIKEVLDKVQANLPQLEALRQQALATQQNIALAKNTLVPDLNLGYQVNMATFNNITGMSYPGFILPISGPPSVSNDLNFVPGAAAGALVKWNPLTFGQRTAAVEKATAQFVQATAAYNEQLFQYQYHAVNIYLEAAYYHQLLKNLQAGINRNAIGLEQSMVLAKTGLRPGIDTAQFQSAMAEAEISLLQTERALQQTMNELSRLTVTSCADSVIILTDTIFSRPAGPAIATAYSVSDNPYYQNVAAQKNITEAGLKEIQKLWVPQLDIWGNLYARGSGVDAAGHIDKAAGLNLSRTNAGIGLQLSFPVLQYSKVKIKKKQYQQLLKADDARLLQAQLDINRQTVNAIQQYQQDLKIAAKSPLLLKSAANVYEGLKLSYETGLVDYTRLAQSQYELLKAEVNDANAHLQVWRSLLAISVAKGNLNLFTDQLK